MATPVVRHPGAQTKSRPEPLSSTLPNGAVITTELAYASDEEVASEHRQQVRRALKFLRGAGTLAPSPLN